MMRSTRGGGSRVRSLELRERSGWREKWEYCQHKEWRGGGCRALPEIPQCSYEEEEPVKEEPRRMWGLGAQG